MSELDKILVSIGADLKDLDKGFTEAVNKTKAFETKANKLGKDTGSAYTKGFLDKIQAGSLERGLHSSFTKMGSIANKGMLYITGPILSAGTALFALSSKAGETADRLLDLEQITGLSTDAIQEWQYVAAGAGVQSEAMTSAVEGLVRRLPQLEDGTGNAAKAFDKLGINYESWKKQKPEEQVDAVMYSLAGMENVLERNSLGSQIFGGAWKDIAPILGEGAAGIAKLRKESKDLGAVIDKDTLESANKLRAEMDKLKFRTQAMGLELGGKLAPVFTETLVPAIEQGLGAISRFVDKIVEMDSKDLAFFGKLAIGLAVLPPLIKGLSTVGFGFLKVVEYTKLAVEALKSFTLAGAVAHLPLMGALAFAGGALALFVGVLWNAEDESMATAQGIGDQFAALGQRVLGVVQFIGAIGASIVGVGVSLIGSLIQIAIDRVQKLLDVGSKIPIIGKGAEWASTKLGSASDWISSNKNKVMDFGKSQLDKAMFRMDRPMDAVIRAREKKGITKTPEYSLYPKPQTTEIQAVPDIDDFAVSVDRLGEVLKQIGEDFKSTADSIGGSIGLFDRFRIKTTSTYKLLRNARERERAFSERERVLQSLGSRGLSDDLMNKLQNTSVDQLGDLRGLERMSNEQLQMWAGSQSVAENSIKRQAVNQVVHNTTLNINMKQVESDRVAKDIMNTLKRNGISIA